MTQIDKKRLTKDDWILAGFRALSRKGVAGLKAEALAREIKATKGSFYWHFRDVADFQASMLEYWRVRATEDIIKDLGRHPLPAREQLKRLVEYATADDGAHGGRRAELALREWGAADRRVASALREVDRRRIGFVKAQLLRAGVDEDHADLAASGLYASLIGFDHLEVLGVAEARTGLLAMLELILRSASK